MEKLNQAIDDYSKFIKSDDFHPDKIGKYEAAIVEAALVERIGPSIIYRFNEKMVRY